MREKKRFAWLWALLFAIPGGCFFSMVFFVVGTSYFPNSEDLIMAFAYGLFMMVGGIGALAGLFTGLLLGVISPKKWGVWGVLLAGLVAAVLSGLAAAWFVLTL